MKADDDFPRGKIQSSNHRASFTSKATAIPKGTSSKNARKRKRSLSPDSRNIALNENTELFSSADGLTYKKVQEGMLLLGCIRAISPLSIDIELPGKMVGKIRINSISEIFCNILREEYIQDKLEEGKDLARLNTMFNLGQFIPTKVLEKTETAAKTSIILSMDPMHINSDWNYRSFKKGLLLWAAVSSKLDHGYLLDAGIVNTRIFLSFKNIDEDTTLVIGQPLYCVIEECEVTSSVTTIQTTILKNKLEGAIQEAMSLHNLVPGMQFDFTVTKSVKYGLQGKFMNNCVGLVNDAYLKTSGYRREQAVKAWLLYVEPTTKFAYFTFKNVYTLSNPAYRKGTILRAQIISKAGGGLNIRLPNKTKGFVSNRRLFNMLPKNNNLNDAISKRFRTESFHQCRILDYNTMEDVYIATFEPSIINEKYLIQSDVKIGELITVKVIKITKEGLQVSFGKLKGFIHNIHLSNSRYSENIKKLFTVGKLLQARVLSIDEKGIYLTNKQELVNSDVCLSSYTDAVVNQQYPGVVVNKSVRGVLVVFYGHVRGMIHQKYLLKMYPDYTDDMYYEGQVLLTTVNRIQNDGLHLTLNPRLKSNSKSLHVGKYVKAVVTGINKDGLIVEVQSYQVKAFIPTAHLSSSLNLTSFLLETYKVGDSLNHLLCLSIKGLPILSIREAFAYKTQNLDIIDFKNLQVGSLIRSSYENSDKSGIYVSTPFLSKSIRIRISNEELIDKKYDVKSLVFQPQQAIVLKVLKLDEHHNIHATAKLMHVFDRNYQYSLGLLEQYFRDIESIRQCLLKNTSPFAELQVGQHVQCVVTAVTENHCKVLLENNIVGVVFKNHYQKSVRVGEKLKGVLLFVNYIENYVELSLNQKVIEKVNKVQDGIVDNEPANSSQRALILKNHPDCIISVLQNKGTNGQLIYLPSKIHENAFNLQLQLEEFSKIKVFIHGKIKDRLIGMDRSVIHKWNKEQGKKRKRENKVDTNKKARLDLHSTDNIQEECTSEVEEEQINLEYTAESDDELECEFENCDETVDSSLEQDDTDEEQVQDNEQNNLSSGEEDESLDSSLEEDKVEKDDRNENNVSNVNGTKKLSLYPGGVTFLLNETKVRKVDNTLVDEDVSENKTEEKKQKKLTPAERKELARLEEEALIKIETENADLIDDPQTVEQFQKLVKAKPNCSRSWSKYIAHLVSHTEIEKAKTVIQEALETINMQLTAERFNIWIVRLNLENNYGDKNSFEEVFNEAVRCNDALEIYIAVIKMLAASQKNIEMEEKIQKAKMKFGKDALHMWVEIGRIYYENGQLREARNTKDAGVTKLGRKTSQISLIIQFAIMEFQYGERNHAEALFETILQHDPRRVDIWNTYVDQVIKTGDFDSVRRILQRAVSQSIPVKKLKSLFKKYKDFETKYGSKEQVGIVVELAKKCAAGL